MARKRKQVDQKEEPKKPEQVGKSDEFKVDEFLKEDLKTEKQVVSKEESKSLKALKIPRKYYKFNQ